MDMNKSSFLIGATEAVDLKHTRTIAIVDEVIGWVLEAARQRLFSNQTLRYHVDIMLVPNAQGTPEPVTSILLAIDSPLIGQKLSAMTLVPGATPFQQHVEEATKGLLQNLLDQRSQLLDGLG